MECPNCHFEVSEEDDVCPYCGEELVNMDEESLQGETKEYEEDFVEGQTRRQSRSFFARMRYRLRQIKQILKTPYIPDHDVKAFKNFGITLAILLVLFNTLSWSFLVSQSIQEGKGLMNAVIMENNASFNVWLFTVKVFLFFVVSAMVLPILIKLIFTIMRWSHRRYSYIFYLVQFYSANVVVLGISFIAMLLAILSATTFMWLLFILFIIEVAGITLSICLYFEKNSEKGLDNKSYYGIITLLSIYLIFEGILFLIIF